MLVCVGAERAIASARAKPKLGAFFSVLVFMSTGIIDQF